MAEPSDNSDGSIFHNVLILLRIDYYLALFAFGMSSLQCTYPYFLHHINHMFTFRVYQTARRTSFPKVSNTIWNDFCLDLLHSCHLVTSLHHFSELSFSFLAASSFKIKNSFIFHISSSLLIKVGG